MIRRALWIGLSGMALMSASSIAGAEPPPPATAASAAPSAPAAPAPNSAPPAPAAAPAAAPGHPAATPPPPAPSPYPHGSPYGYWRQGPPAPTLEASAATKRYWYGWQTLTVFGTSGVLIALTPLTGKSVALPLSLGGFVLGGPIVHWANGNVGKGFISLGINVGAPLLVGLTAGALCTALCRDTDSGLQGVAAALVGGGVGLLIANVIDVAALSYGERKPVYNNAAARRQPSITWLPTLDAGKGRASVGLVGTF